jgi:hypothetical protein
MTAKILRPPSHSNTGQALPEIEVDAVLKGDQIHVNAS